MLTDTRTGAVVASVTEEGAWGDLFALQDRIIDALAAALAAVPPAAGLRAAAMRRRKPGIDEETQPAR